MSARTTGMLSFVTGLSGGYLTARERKMDRDARDEDRAWKREERERQRKDWERKDTLDQSVRSAAAPVSAQDASIEQPAVDDEGYAMPANPTTGRKAVMGKTYDDPTEADAAVTAANAPRARMARVADAYAGAGEIDKAEQIKTSVRQGEVADLQHKQLTETDDRTRKMREAGSLLARGGWGAVPTLYDRYDDGLSARVEEDGKGGATVITIDKDGKEVGKQAYRDIPHLFETVAGQFDPKLWLDASAKRRDDDRADARDANSVAYQGRMAAVAEKNADTNESYRRDMADAAGVRAANSAKTPKDPLAKMPEHEKLAYQSLNKRISDLEGEITKAELGGMADPAAIGRARSQKAALQLQSSSL